MAGIVAWRRGRWAPICARGKLVEERLMAWRLGVGGVRLWDIGRWVLRHPLCCGVLCLVLEVVLRTHFYL